MLSARQELASTIDTALREQGRKNELYLAAVRALALLGTTAVDIYGALSGNRGNHGWTMAVIMAAAFAVSAVFAWLLARGFYHRSLPFLVPAAEAVFIAVAFYTAQRSLPIDTFLGLGASAVVALVCALFALSGAFRLTAGSVVVTTAFGMAIFAHFFQARHGFTPVLVLSLSLIAAIAVLGAAVTRLVRQMFRAQVGRLMLGRFLPEALLEQAHDRPLSLLEQPRAVTVTVLISDLRGFTAWAEHQPPARTFEQLSLVQGALARIVHEHGGTVDKFLGDGMLAVFGALEPLPDHAARAVATALAMIEQVAGVSSSGAGISPGEAPFKLGIGVHTGDVVVGALGSGARLEFTVIGDAVNTASRLESATKELGAPAAISADTARLCSRDAGLVSLGTLRLRGKSNEIEVFTFDKYVPVSTRAAAL